MSSIYSSSSTPPQIIVGYTPSSQDQQCQHQSISIATSVSTSKIYRLPTNLFYSNQNFTLSETSQQSEIKNHIFVHSKNTDENHIDSNNYNTNNGFREQLTSDTKNEVFMYPPSTVDSLPLNINNDVKLIINSSLSNQNTSITSKSNGSSIVKVIDSTFKDNNATPILVQNHQNVVTPQIITSNIPALHHYSVLPPYPILSTNNVNNNNLSDLNNSNVEYVVVQNNNETRETKSVDNNFQYMLTQPPSLIPNSSNNNETPFALLQKTITVQDNSRRERNLEAKRRRLENETEEDRARRRARDAETKRMRRQRESSEQRARRLMRDSQRMRRTRRIKRLLGPTATLSDLKKTGLTLEDLDSLNASEKRRNNKSPINSQFSTNSQQATIVVSAQPPSSTQIKQENTQEQQQSFLSQSVHLVRTPNISYNDHQHTVQQQLQESLLPQQSTQICYANAIGTTMIPISSQTIASLAPGSATLVATNGTFLENSTSTSGYVTLHVTLPPGSDPQQPQILHLPSAHSLPQHIIVQRQTPINTPMSPSFQSTSIITTMASQHSKPLPSVVHGTRIIQQKVVSTSSGPQLTTISTATPIPHYQLQPEQKIINNQIQQTNTLTSIEIPAHLVQQQSQILNLPAHSQHSIVYRTVQDDYEIDNYKNFLVHPLTHDQDNHHSQQQLQNYVNVDTNVPTTSTCQTQICRIIVQQSPPIIKNAVDTAKNVRTKIVRSTGNNYTTQLQSNAIQTTNFNLQNARLSERYKGLSDEQILRRRRANAERSRRRRQLETPEQRQERNRRTAERMRISRARLAEERILNKFGNDGAAITISSIPTPRKVVPLSADRFEEIFQMVLNKSHNNSKSSNNHLIHSDISSVHVNQSHYVSKQENNNFDNSNFKSIENSILHTQMCSTPSYLIDDKQNDNNFAFELGSDQNEQEIEIHCNQIIHSDNSIHNIFQSKEDSTNFSYCNNDFENDDHIDNYRQSNNCDVYCNNIEESYVDNTNRSCYNNDISIETETLNNKTNNKNSYLNSCNVINDTIEKKFNEKRQNHNNFTIKESSLEIEENVLTKKIEITSSFDDKTNETQEINESILNNNVCLLNTESKNKLKINNKSFDDNKSTQLFNNAEKHSFSNIMKKIKTEIKIDKDLNKNTKTKNFKEPDARNSNV